MIVWNRLCLACARTSSESEQIRLVSRLNPLPAGHRQSRCAQIIRGLRSANPAIVALPA